MKAEFDLEQYNSWHERCEKISKRCGKRVCVHLDVYPESQYYIISINDCEIPYLHAGAVITSLRAIELTLDIV